jgi:hypothetical protein
MAILVHVVMIIIYFRVQGVLCYVVEMVAALGAKGRSALGGT